MSKRVFFSLFCFLIISCLLCSAQVKDSTKKDSLRVYRKIEEASRKNKVFRRIYRELFRPLPVKASSRPIPEKKRKIIRAQDYRRFQGKIIRKIEVTSFDPFGYDSKDTARVPRSLLEKGGNTLHIKTMRKTVRGLLIVKVHDVFDSLRVRESERLVRSQSFVHEVFFEAVLARKGSDSVDIFIRVYDLWSIIVNTDVSPTHFTLDIKDKSFLGLGHQFQNVYGRNYSTNAEHYRTNYYVPNIYNTYISSSFALDVDEKNNYNRSISINRPFYSAFAKWAGGANYLQHRNTEVLYDADSVSFKQNYRYNMNDYWAGKAWRIRSGASEEARTTQLILSSRVMNQRYVEKPSAYFDSLNLYSNETFYFTGVSLSKRRYEQDHFIFRYGNTEDVPVGKAYTLINGYQIRNDRPRYYLGARIYWGQYYSHGYVSANLEYGTFFRNSMREEGSITGGVNYFTNIFNIGKWRIRQFVKPQCTIGLKRPLNDNLSINNELGIRGFTSTGLSGKSQKVLLTLQTQTYAPWNLLGFRFGPYFISSFGMLGTSTSGFRRSCVYSQYGIGLLIRNEYLIYHSIQISVAFYPTIPGIGHNIFKINPVKTTDFGFRDFDVGRPATVAYQ